MTPDTATTLLSRDKHPTSQRAYSLPSVVIEPSEKLFHLELKELWQYRELLYFLVWRDIKVRYKQTVIGAGWAVIQPLVTMVVFTVIFSYWARIPSEGFPYPIFAYAGLLPWMYFSKSVERSGISVVSEGGLINKVYFPRLIIPLAATLGGLLDFGITLAVFIVMMAWYGISPGFGMLALPVLLGITLATSLSVSLWLSAFHVKYRDVGATIPLLIQLWMFASPIAYPISLVPERWLMLYSLNPMVGVIEGFRWALLGSASPNFLAMGMSTAIVFILMLGGLVFFKRLEHTFTDVI